MSSSGILTFSPGDKVGDCQLINVTIIEDLRLELNESFSVVLSNLARDASVVTINQADASVLIVDNDGML